jgi:hypothetical protein
MPEARLKEENITETSTDNTKNIYKTTTMQKYGNN